jgi:hypothetical protein
MSRLYPVNCLVDGVVVKCSEVEAVVAIDVPSAAVPPQ